LIVQLTIAGSFVSLPIVGDLDGALREAAVSLEELSGHDEPVFKAIAEFAVGSLEMALGRYDDALRHLREARGLAERPGGDWLPAASPVQLGNLAVLRGKLDEARALMDEALDLGLAARSTPFVTLCLAAYARLALAEGDSERAARLKGATEGLRQRVGLPAWPDLRRLEEELVAQIRQKLSADQFDQAFSDGSELAQRQAIDMVRNQRRTGPRGSEPHPGHSVSG
jgi:ATP/maltotriose-dependent transcriptional regulator MalT